MAEEKREQERETMDKNAFYFCTTNLHKLVSQVPLRNGVLDNGLNLSRVP